MTRPGLLSGWLLAMVLAASSTVGAQEPAFEIRWKFAVHRGASEGGEQGKLQSSAHWPPVVSGDRLVVRGSDGVTAHSVSTGKILWTHRVALRPGELSVAASDRLVYLITSQGIELLDAATGSAAGKRALTEAQSVLYQGGSVYVAGAAGLLRLDESGTKIMQKMVSLRGELRAADGDYVAIYRQLSRAEAGKHSPKRLTVANLRTGKVAFEFKLLPAGSHRVARMAEGRIVFIDFTQRKADGTNARKLFYTEADYVAGKKLRDISLEAKYGSATIDNFWITAPSSGKVFLANHGKSSQGSSLFGFDPEQAKTLWTRTGEVAEMGLLLAGARLWTGVSKKSGDGQLVAYSPETGDVVARLALDSAGVGSPVEVGDSILVRTRRSIYGIGMAKAAAAPPAVTWRQFRDRVAGYLLQVPTSWAFNRVAMRKLGGMRFVVPFIRNGELGGKPTVVGTMHVLTWEAAGRDARGLWKSIQSQRARTSSKLRVLSVVPIAAQGPAGPPALLATYSFRSAAGEPVQMRSLCLISHEVAFELRAWVSPSAPVQVWQEVEGIFKSFEPKSPSSF